MPFKMPPFQVYELAPVAVKFTVAPAQIESFGEAVMLMVGNKRTVMDCVLILIHPFISVAVTV